MTYLPYAVRHVQRTLEDLIEARLSTLGWLGPTNSVPFGAAIVRNGEGQAHIQRGRMDEAALQTVTGNMVAVSFGNEPDDEPQEMGGGLLMVEHYLFVDVVGEKEAIALAIASDIKDALGGRASGTSRYSAVYDYTDTPRTLVVGYRLELTDVVRQEGDPKVKRHWQIVKATAELVYTSEEDGS